MIAVLAVALLAFVVLSLLGIGVILLFPVRWRSRMLLLAPVIGLAFAVIVLHLIALRLPMGAAPWILPLSALVLGVLGWFIHRRSPRETWRRLRGRFLGAGIVAAVGLLVAPIAKISTGAVGLVQSSFNNDAFYYVAVARWLSEHSATQAPQIGASPSSGADSPAFGPAFSTLHDSLRFGQELVHSWFGSFTGIDLVDSFTAMSAVWIALIGVSAYFLARLIISGVVRPVLVGLLATLSAPVLFQVAAQNSDSLAGASLALALAGLVLLVVRDRGPLAGWLPLATLAALLLAALAGTYSEYLSFMAPFLVILVFVGQRTGIRPALERSLVIIVASVVLGVWPWMRAVQNIIFISSIPAGVPLPHGRALLFEVLGPAGDAARTVDARLPGVGVALAGALVVLIAIGLLFAFRARRPRAFAIGVVVAVGVLLGWAAARNNVYMLVRSIALAAPFIVVAAAAGWYSARTAWNRLPRRILTGVSVGVAIALLANATLFAATQLRPWDQRTVGSNLKEAAGWIDAVAGPAGADASVVTGDFFDQLWISELLADKPDVSYVTLRGDLGYRGRLDMDRYWDGEVDRYLLVGPGAQWSADATAVVHRNSEYVLIDTHAGSFSVVTPTSPTADWAIYADRQGISGQRGASVDLITNQAHSTILVSTDPTNSSLEWTTAAVPGWTVSSSAGTILVDGPGAASVVTLTSTTGSATGLHLQGGGH